MENNKLLNNTTYLDKIHKEILSIALEFMDIADRLHLKYYLAYGSLLGAVRHNGFIPWDDDMDFWMPRKDYKKLIKYFQNNNVTNLSLRSNRMDRKYKNPFIKICRDNTIFYEHTLRYNNYNQGIFIDIFPLDNLHFPNKLVTLTNTNKAGFFFVLDKYYKLKPPCNKGIKAALIYILWKCIPAWFLRFLSRLILNINNLIKSENIAVFTSERPSCKFAFKKSDYGDGTFMDFEGKKIMVPKKYNKILKAYYGTNYMDVPPENKRISHFPGYVKFSDGTEIAFDNNTTKYGKG